MSSDAAVSVNALERAIGPDGGGFAFVEGAAMAGLLDAATRFADWDAFANSWNRLETDTYMADGGRYRKRRYATFEANPPGRIVRAPHQPHFQTLDYNPLNGGVPRWFAPIEDDIGRGPSLNGILSFCAELFGRLAPSQPWHIEVHQFRIEARVGEAGRPTPEGLHRDGVDYVLVLLIDRLNIASGMTTIHALDGRHLGHFTLTHPFDSALIDDSRVAHGVTPVEPLDPTQPAHRDVLVVTFRKLGAGG